MLCLLDKNYLYLIYEDVLVTRGAVIFLKPSEEITTELAGDKYLTISKVIPLARALQQLTSAAATNIMVGDKLCSQMIVISYLRSQIMCLLLPPFSEEVAFGTTGAAEQCVQHLPREMWIRDCATCTYRRSSTESSERIVESLR